ncbi:hypothetical protein MHYP_G00047460 [Metynnis hypsauchen]
MSTSSAQLPLRALSHPDSVPAPLISHTELLKSTLLPEAPPGGNRGEGPVTESRAAALCLHLLELIHTYTEIL